MELDRNPFVVSALADLTEGRTRRVTTTDLLSDAAADPTDPHDEFRVTSTFMSLWDNLPSAGTTNKTTVASVMRGINVERRHPAFRVQPTGLPDTYQAPVGNNVTLVFHDQPDTPEQNTPQVLIARIWLAVLHHA